MGYVAKGNQVFVEQTDREPELFLTVHPTDTGGTMTPEQQVIQIADDFNGKITEASIKILELERTVVERAVRAYMACGNLQTTTEFYKLRAQAELWARFFDLATMHPEASATELAQRIMGKK